MMVRVRSLRNFQALGLCFVVLASVANLAAAQYTDSCTQTQSGYCDKLAICMRVTGATGEVPDTDFQCTCPPGVYGDGYAASEGCSTNAGVIRTSFKIGTSWDAFLDLTKTPIMINVENDLNTIKLDVTTQILAGSTLPSYYDESFTYSITGTGANKYFTANVIYENLAAAEAQLASLDVNLLAGDLSATTLDIHGTVLHFNTDDSVGQMAAEPRAYAWTTGTTDDPLTIMPTGLEVDKVYFKRACLSAGCWVVDLTYTTGEDNWNVFYLPRSNNSDTLSYDFDYDANLPDFANTFFPVNFPCGNDQYDPADSLLNPGVIPTAVSACCIPQFASNYRPMDAFDTWHETEGLPGSCPASPDGSGVGQNPPTYSLTNSPSNYVEGTFSDAVEMPLSNIVTTAVIDPYLGIYQATLYLDEQELRKYAGKLTGTVGVLHEIDTFIGLAEFKPTGLKYIDMFTKQVEIHLEKTDFFAVSTHGENAYTFLEYINLRLVQVYDQSLPAVDAGNGNTRTPDTVKAQYVQLTFTMGAEYSKKPNMDVLPLDSVRLGKGTFFSESAMKHACVDYLGGVPSMVDTDEMGTLTSADVAQFDTMLNQDCGPQSSMCANPEAIPDQFVAFNIPAGMDWFPAAANDLSQQVFVSAVVQVQNENAMDGTDPDASNITKTTITAAIPVVQGGINIFCDGIAAATDLTDVARAVIIVGSAEDESEITRLRIFGEDEDITSSAVGPTTSKKIDTDSIESALMTLVVMGNASFFQPPALPSGGRAASDFFGLEVEDIITIHIMEENTGFDAGRAKEVLDLVVNPAAVEPTADDTYSLNGAFNMRVIRAEKRARLDPSDALLDICAFSATRPTLPGSFPVSCIIRRDIDGKNNYPIANGADWATAMELPHCAPADATCATTVEGATAPAGGGGVATDVEDFMASVLGGSEYARNLGTSFAGVIAKRYQLNDIENRAFWINPGYEWTPTQTGGQSRFQVSQKLVFFALINLNENREVDATARRSMGRRFLLQSTAEVEKGSGMAQMNMEFETSPAKLIASALQLPEEQVARFTIQVQLTRDQACMPRSELQPQLRDAMEVYFTQTASQLATVQITGLSVAMNGVTCSRRALGSRALLAAYSDAVATVDVIVAFDTPDPIFNKVKFEELPGVVSVTATDNVRISVDETFVAPSPISRPVPNGDTPKDDAPATPVALEAEASDNTMVIGAVVAVVAVLAAGAAFFMYKKRQTTHEAQVIGALSVSDMKVAQPMGAAPIQQQV